jgi:hypothetical protein
MMRAFWSVKEAGGGSKSAWWEIAVSGSFNFHPNEVTEAYSLTAGGFRSDLGQNEKNLSRKF